MGKGPQEQEFFAKPSMFGRSEELNTPQLLQFNCVRLICEGMHECYKNERGDAVPEMIKAVRSMARKLFMADGCPEAVVDNVLEACEKNAYKIFKEIAVALFAELDDESKLKTLVGILESIEHDPNRPEGCEEALERLRDTVAKLKASTSAKAAADKPKAKFKNRINAFLN